MISINFRHVIITAAILIKLINNRKIYFLHNKMEMHSSANIVLTMRSAMTDRRAANWGKMGRNDRSGPPGHLSQQPGPSSSTISTRNISTSPWQLLPWIQIIPGSMTLFILLFISSPSTVTDPGSIGRLSYCDLDLRILIGRDRDLDQWGAWDLGHNSKGILI